MRTFGNSQGAHLREELLSAYLDGQVTAAERAQAEAHLQTCPACREVLEGLRQTVALLQALPRVPTPRAFTLSEAQVGIRRPEARPWWSGAWVRGLGALTAVAVVALLATTMLRAPGWAPQATVARALPTSTVSQPEVAEAVVESAAAPQALAAEPAPAPVTQVVEAPQAEARQVAPPIEAEAADAAAPAAVPAPAEPAAAKAGEPLAEVQAPPQELPAAPTQALALEVEAPPAAPAQAPARALEGGPQAPGAGLGGGIGAGGTGIGAAALAAVGPEAALTPAAAPAAAAFGSVLPKSAGAAYSDWESLVLLDANSDGRELVRAAGVYAPDISDDRSWVAYRSEGLEGMEIGLASWDGATQQRLVSDGELAAEPLAPGYASRSIQTMRWLPGQKALGVVTTAFPENVDQPPVQELWRVAVPSGERTRILEMGMMGRVFFSSDGQRMAVLEYGTIEAPEGSLTLYGADGSKGQQVLQFPAAPGTPAGATQLQWAANGSLLLAVPDGSAPGLTLYRVSKDGSATQAGRIEAQEAFWSPDGGRLAYTRAATGATGDRELVLAQADGADPQVFAPLRDGQFLGWSPDGKLFLYVDDYEVYVGGPARKPELVGNLISVFDPRWAAPGQIVALLDQGAEWMLVWRNLETGEAASLAALPKDISWDFVSP